MAAREREQRVNILVLNSGSATLKFDVVSLGGARSDRKASGIIEDIGGSASVRLDHAGIQTECAVNASTYGEALEAGLDVLAELNLLRDVVGVGHRVVHGGSRFREAVVVDNDVITGIRAVSDLAPLHNPRALEVIEASRARLGDSLPTVVCFDTAFYADLPESAATYALPRDLMKKHDIRRFGFHGLAHAFMVQRYAELRPEVSAPRLITLQLGNGCSATACLDGRPIQTSMGYTPLEGLVMGTRSGNIDPALALRLPAMTGMAAFEVEELLNKQSGLLGLSGRSADMRELLTGANAGDEACKLAIELFAMRTREYVGAYTALLNGADAIVFGGGIGENSPEIRAMILGSLDQLGIQLNDAANSNLAEGERVISQPSSPVEVWLMRVDEASVIAKETARLVSTTA